MKKKGSYIKFLLFAIISIEIAVIGSSSFSKALLCEKKSAGDGATSSITAVDEKIGASTQAFVAPKADAVSPLLEDDDLHGVIPRAFPMWSHPFPCFPPDDNWHVQQVQRSPAHKGLLYAKEMKTGSSTLSGVNIRIARGYANRTANVDFPICKARFDHSMATTLDYAHRVREESFLWTVIRHPAKRAISQFFHFEVSRAKVEPSDKNFLQYLKLVVFQNYYLQSLAMTPFRPNDKRHDPIEFTNQILLDYDFIGITERMDESLVVLSMLLPGVELTDLLYIYAKGSGGFDDGQHKWKCHYIIPSYLSPGMKEFFQSSTWKDRNVGDDLLYKAAWKSMDMTIDRLGRSKVEEQLEQFRAMRALAEEMCAPRALFPCNADGTRANRKTGCLWNDSGCGNQCLDELTQMLKE